MRPARLPSARTRRRCAVWIVAMWAQVFVVLPGAHLVDHHHDDHDHHGGFVRWLIGDDHDDDHAHDHAAPERPSTPLDHGADAAAHFDVAIVDPPPALPRLHHHAAVDGPLVQAPRALDQARPSHGWMPPRPTRITSVII